jgi:hypothetical protein
VGEPSAILAPVFMTTQRSHRLRMASITCSTTMIVRPSARKASTREIPVLNSVGFSPASHSSSSNTLGSEAKARASSTRF